MRKSVKKSLTEIKLSTITKAELKNLKGGNDENSEVQDYIITEDIVNG